MRPRGREVVDVAAGREAVKGGGREGGRREGAREGRGRGGGEGKGWNGQAPLFIVRCAARDGESEPEDAATGRARAARVAVWWASKAGRCGPGVRSGEDLPRSEAAVLDARPRPRPRRPWRKATARRADGRPRGKTLVAGGRISVCDGRTDYLQRRSWRWGPLVGPGPRSRAGRRRTDKNGPCARLWQRHTFTGFGQSSVYEVLDKFIYKIFH
jgi:hypothetical protein